MYIDIALKAFGNDIGWFGFQEHTSKITYKHIIDAILNKFNNSVPDKNILQVRNSYLYFFCICILFIFYTYIPLFNKTIF